MNSLLLPRMDQIFPNKKNNNTEKYNCARCAKTTAKLSGVNHKEADRSIRGEIEMYEIPLIDLNKTSSSFMSATILYQSLYLNCGKKEKES